MIFFYITHKKKNPIENLNDKKKIPYLEQNVTLYVTMHNNKLKQFAGYINYNATSLGQQSPKRRRDRNLHT